MVLGLQPQIVGVVLAQHKAPGAVKIPRGIQDLCAALAFFGHQIHIIKPALVQHLIHALNQVDKQPGVNGVFLVGQRVQHLAVFPLGREKRLIIVVQRLPHLFVLAVLICAARQLIAGGLSALGVVLLRLPHQRIHLKIGVFALLQLPLLIVDGIAQRIQAPVTPIQKQL